MSAEGSFRDSVRHLTLQMSGELIDFVEMDFQPSEPRSFWSRRRPAVKHEGVIKSVELDARTREGISGA